MKTTVVLAEHVVVGLVGGLLLCLVAAAVFGFYPFTALLAADPAQWIILLFGLYALGIIWGRLADASFSKIDSRWKHDIFGSDHHAFHRAYHRALLEIHAQQPDLSNSITQVRSEYRIARAVAFTALLWFLLAVLQCLRLGVVEPRLLVMQIVGSVLLFLASLSTYRHLRRHYLNWVKLYAERAA